MIKDAIKEMITQTIETCESWVEQSEDGLFYFVDPIDGEEISAHYGATHAAVSFILYGERTENAKLSSKGYSLMESILKRWDISKRLPGFHNDFNNFALCVAWEYVSKNASQKELADRIREIVLSTPDSNNPTVNWFPMRWYVNLLRFKWTGLEKYKAECDKCRNNIKSATFKDGFIDDRLPMGLSFNLQYDVATVAVMQYLRSNGEEIDLSVELGALINVVAPDGDINYIGRGTNQIFAWGLWVYLLASAGKEKQLDGALIYLKDRVPEMLKNNNMMLNKWPGKEKYMWWDYHYCSVYTAHFLFWLIMAEQQQGLYPINEKISEPSDSGIRIYRGQDYFVTTFSGRKEYLAEKGPCIGALWTKNAGMIIKGNFGPWQGAFGNKYSPLDVTIRNNCGLFKVDQNIDYSKNRYLHKAFPNLEKSASETIGPLFEKMSIRVESKNIVIEWISNEKQRKILSVPKANDSSKLSLKVDNIDQMLFNTLILKNQYTWCYVYQSSAIDGKNWELRIER